MNCYICEFEARRRPIGLSGLPERAAVAVCHECGAGACFDHAVVLEEPPHHLPAARLFACATCALADVPAEVGRAA
ncbi:hypothetical protein GCM10009609_30030 [Pseudonocardia aurantiaca]|uniref:DUF2180 family protein n=1 Tax=Pseudonocardia aurantiaca TaxID=75290 RepID=A0ABW4FTH6_9PSEU